ncbi:hypothetical protein FACS189441_4100 [Betaproteobacteria bacterium]|nr:hypothetical protein FACS189441_4100 [Betaproteobacteria bacterium]
MKTSNAVLKENLKDNALPSVKPPINTPEETHSELSEMVAGMIENFKRMNQDEAYRQEITKRGF